MADGSDDLREFLLSLNDLFDRIKRVQIIGDLDELEHCGRKLEDYVSLLNAISVAVSENTWSENDLLQRIVDQLIEASHRKLQEISELFVNITRAEKGQQRLNLSSTGRMPAYDLTKEQIEQLV